MGDVRDGAATRRRILVVVEQSRAIHKSELCRQVDRAWGTVGYHLRVLQRNGLITTETAGGVLWIHPSRLARPERREARILAEQSATQVLAAVKAQPGATVNDLEVRLDLPAKTIRRHLSQLLDAGVVERQGRRPQQFNLARVPWSRRRDAAP